MKKTFTISLVALLISLKLIAQSSFYDENTIQLIEITFTQTNWDYMLDTAKAGSESYIMASNVKINGVQFDSVGVKYKGNSSYNPNQVKNPFHIELDTYKDQNYEGFTDIKLGNGFKDPSFIREVLSYKIARDYMPAPQSNFANVYINNQLIGLYSNSESVGKKYVDAHFGSKSNTFIKCNPINGAGPGGNAYPNLVYLGADSSLYYTRYELESDYGWFDLVNFCDTLANHTAAIESIINVNQALWMLAYDNLLVNLDSYLGGFTQNYYLYKDDYSLIQPVIWDLNESFGTFSNTGTIMLNTTLQKQQMTHLLHASDAGWPLVKKLLAMPMYKRMYMAQMRTILAEHFANNSYYTQGLALQTLIGPDVNADTHKFYSYANFISNLNTDVNIGNGTAPGITNLMNGRNNYLSALADFTAAQPVISAIAVSDQEPAIGASLNITASVSNALGNAVYLAFRSRSFAPFLRIPMLDDGLHGDGASGDGIFGSTISINSGKTEYYLYAENSQAGIFSPQRAEKEFYTLISETSASGKIVINELLASNATIAADQNDEYDDWVEIYNHSNETIALDSTYLSDSYSNIHKWRFPDGTVILPTSYLIVWADDDTLQTGLHTNFKLSASGERLALSDADGAIIDSISFGAQTTDISMQRCPNDIGNFIFASPSYNAINNCPTSIEERTSASGISVYTNPFCQRLHISAGETILRTVRIVNLMGQTVFFKEGNLGSESELNLDNLSNGMYVIIVNNEFNHTIIKH